MGGKAKDPNKAAMKAQRDQLKRLDRIDVPELQEYMLQAPELVGLLDAEQIGDSALEDISTDPRLRQAQLQTLSDLEQESEEGLTAMDRLQMEELMDQAGAQGQAQRAAIQAQMERQGLGNSGAALAAKLQGSQGSANALRKQAMQMLAQSGDRRRQARRDRANLAGQMEGQDFSRQAQVASARDAINRANAMNRQQVNQLNLAARQNIANQQTNTANMQAGMANQLAQQNFQNQLSKATGQGSVANSMSQIAANTPAKPSAFQAALGGAAQGAAIGSAVPGIGTGIGAAVGGLGGLLGAEDGAVAYQDGGLVEGGVPVDRKALEAHQKQEANFKRKYMKKIHSELLGEDNPNGKYIKAEDGALAQTNYQDPKFPVGTRITPDFSGLPVEYGGGAKSPSLKELRQAQGQYDAKQKREDELYGAGVVASGKTKLEEGQSLDDLRSEKADTEMAGKLTKGLGALNKLLGAEPQQKRRLDLGQFNMEMPENVMNQVSPVDYGNPFVQSAEDGALIQAMEESGELTEEATDFASPDDRQSAVYSILSDAMNRMKGQEIPMSPEEDMMQKLQAMQEVPAMEDGGTYQAQDGSLMFTSDGMGDIVEGDSFERDRVDAKLNSGEMVLNAAQQQRLMDMLRGEISSDDLGDEDIVEGVPRDYQEDLMEGGDDKDVQAKGMNRLLDMLGRK